MTSGTGQQTVSLAPGTYNIAETVPSEWTLTSSSCTNGTPSAITIIADQSTTCTFNNSKAQTSTDTTTTTTPPPSKQGTLKIVKNANGGDDAFLFTVRARVRVVATYYNNSPSQPKSPFPSFPINKVEVYNSCLYLPNYIMFYSGCPVDFIFTSTVTIQTVDGIGVASSEANVTSVGKWFELENLTFPYEVTEGKPYTSPSVPPGWTTAYRHEPYNYSIYDPSIIPVTLSIPDTAYKKNNHPGYKECDNYEYTKFIGVVGDGGARVNLNETTTCTFTNGKNANITINVKTIGGDGVFLFRSTFTYLHTFTIDTTATPGSGSYVMENLPPGTYMATEVVPDVWTLTSSSWTLTSSTCGIINLNPGQDTTCDIINTKKGTLKIVKNANGGDDAFSYGVTSRFYSRAMPALDSRGHSSDSHSIINDVETVNGKGSSLAELEPGKYIVYEADLAAGVGSNLYDFVHEEYDKGYNSSLTYLNLYSDYNLSDWTFNSVSCDDGTSTQTTYGILDVTILPGKTTTCTFNNTKKYSDLLTGQIKVVVKTLSGDGIFSFNDNFGVTSLATLDSSVVEQTISSLVPGSSYYISENVPAGWTLTNSGCDNGTPDAIIVRANKTTTCTFNNARNDYLPKPLNKGTLKIVKSTTGGDGQFTFNISPTLFSLTVQTANGTGYDTVALNEGIYNVKEEYPRDKWLFLNATCDKGGPGSVVIKANQTTTCTFNNAKASINACLDPDNAPYNMAEYRGNLKSYYFKLTGDKSAGLGWGGANDTPYTDDSSLKAMAVHSGVVADGEVGIVKVTMLAGEDSYTGNTQNEVTTYSYGPWNGSYTIAKEQSCDMYISSSPPSKQGTLKIVKSTTGGDGQFTFNISPTLFSLTVQTANGTGSNSIMLDAGAYNVQEVIPNGWSLTNVRCDNGNTNNVINNGNTNNVINNVINNVVNVVIETDKTTTCIFSNTKKGILEIIANVNGGDDSFDFDYGIAPVVSSAKYKTSTIQTINGTGGIALELDPNTYFINERIPSGSQYLYIKSLGLEFNSFSCTNQVYEYGTYAYIAIASGKKTTCVFNNTKYTTPTKGTLYITVLDITVYSVNNLYTFNIYLGPKQPSKLSSVLSIAGNNYATSLLDPGDYFIEEIMPEHTQFFSIYCFLPVDTTNPGWMLNPYLNSTVESRAIIGDEPKFVTFCFAPSTKKEKINITKNSIGGDDLFNDDLFNFDAYMTYSPTPEDSKSIITAKGKGNSTLYAEYLSQFYYLKETGVPDDWTTNSANCNNFGYPVLNSLFEPSDKFAHWSGDYTEGLYMYRPLIQKLITTTIGDYYNFFTFLENYCQFNNNKEGILKITFPYDQYRNFVHASADFSVFSNNSTTDLRPSWGYLNPRQYGYFNEGFFLWGYLEQGTYSIREIIPPTLKLDYASCDDETSKQTTYGLDNVTVKAGLITTCTFNNNQFGKLKIVKNANGGDANFNFNVYTDSSHTSYAEDFSYLSSRSTLNNVSITTDNGYGDQYWSQILPGTTYSITEELLARGWVLGSASCKIVDSKGNSTTTGTPTDGGVNNIEISPNNTTICTFINATSSRSKVHGRVPLEGGQPIEGRQPKEHQEIPDQGSSGIPYK